MPTLTPQEAKAISDLIGDMSEFWQDTDHDTAETDKIDEGMEFYTTRYGWNVTGYRQKTYIQHCKTR